VTEFDPIRAAVDIDADWLTAVLHAAGIGIGNSLSVNRSGSIGTGQVGDNVRFVLEWRHPDPSLPQTVIGKFPSQSEISRATAIAVETYVREIGFYRDLQHEVRIRTPHVHHVGWDPETHDFVLMMEDIAPAEQGDQLAGCDLEHAELVIDQAVGLHAPTWGRTDEHADLDWLRRPDAERAANLGAMYSMFIPGFVERYRGRLSDDDLALGEALVQHYPQLSEATIAWAEANHGFCVVHADYRLDNILFGSPPASPAVTVVDWQTVSVGIGPSDVAYFCGAGMLPDRRRQHERALVDRYAAAIRAAGIDLSDAAAWDGYVLGSGGGYLMAVLASQIVERTERGDEMFAVMAERHAAQVRHVGLLDRF
jgi:hypothetical protein